MTIDQLDDAKMDQARTGVARLLAVLSTPEDRHRTCRVLIRAHLEAYAADVDSETAAEFAYGAADRMVTG